MRKILNLTLAKFENLDINSELVELEGTQRHNAEDCILVHNFDDAAVIKEKAERMVAIALANRAKFALLDGFYPLTVVMEVLLRKSGVVPLYPLVEPVTRLNTTNYHPETTYILKGFIEGNVEKVFDKIGISF